MYVFRFANWPYSTSQNEQILFGHYEDLETHLKGVERIVAVRGGVDKLGHGGVLRIMVSWYAPILQITLSPN